MKRFLLSSGFEKEPKKICLSADSSDNSEIIDSHVANSQSPDNVGFCPPHNLDFGSYINKRISDDLKLELLTNTWSPIGNTFVWPFTERKNKGGFEKRYLNSNHLTMYPWLAYSEFSKGLFCKYCVLFAKGTGGKGDNELGSLVTKPLQKYNDLTSAHGPVIKHAETDYHKKAFECGETFKVIAHNPSESILNKINTSRQKQVEENQQRLIPIIKTVIFMGKLGLAFRGHRDDGKIDVQSNESKEGNFRSLLKFRVDSGDTQLENHLRECSSKTMYTSKVIQNELIEICGEIVKENILKNIKNSTFFSILADETTDTSRTEQMSLCIRYVNDGKLREDFLAFVEVKDLTGAGLAKTITELVSQYGLDLSNLVGQGYDGASAMSGQFSGVQAEIRKIYPEAIYVHCTSHSLNLVISKSSDIQAIRNAFGIISELVTFVNSSAKRVDCLKECIENADFSSLKKHLVQLCETRWVERHEAVITFLQLFDPLIDCLEKIVSWRDSNASSKAQMFLNAVSQSEFLISLTILECVLSLTLPVARCLQTPDNDLLTAVNLIENVKSVVSNWRANADETFNPLFKKAEKLAESVNVSISQPRIVGRQLNRSNVQATTPEQYYRCSVFIPYLDNLLAQFDCRFGKHQETVYALSALVPKYIEKYNFETLKPVISFYQKYLDDDVIVKGEYDLWKSISKNNKNMQANVLETLRICDENSFPNIHKLLKIFATIPVTTATNQRTFSSLKLLKTYLRSTMSEKRLTGLALMYIHSDIPVEPELVLEKFGLKNRRKLDFVL